MFESELRKLAPSEKFDEIWASFGKEKSVGFFINHIKTTTNFIKNELENLEISFTKSDFCDFYFISNSDKSRLTKSEIFTKGLIYPLNFSSYLAALNLSPKDGDLVLDMCSSPGGKSIALSNLARIELACMESNKTRFFTLRENLAKFDIRARIFNKDARSVARTCPLKFDKIMLDAPCSSYAKFDENFVQKSKKEITLISKLQKQLLNSALAALKVGGEMIYSTCTFFRQENEEVIENALNSKFGIEILPLNLPQGSAEYSEFGARIWPDDIYSGFFMSKIRKVRDVKSE